YDNWLFSLNCRLISLYYRISFCLYDNLGFFLVVDNHRSFLLFGWLIFFRIVCWLVCLNNDVLLHFFNRYRFLLFRNRLFLIIEVRLFYRDRLGFSWNNGFLFRLCLLYPRNVVRFCFRDGRSLRL